MFVIGDKGSCIEQEQPPGSKVIKLVSWKLFTYNGPGNKNMVNMYIWWIHYFSGYDVAKYGGLPIVVSSMLLVKRIMS